MLWSKKFEIQDYKLSPLIAYLRWSTLKKIIKTFIIKCEIPLSKNTQNSLIPMSLIREQEIFCKELDSKYFRLCRTTGKTEDII